MSRVPEALVFALFLLLLAGTAAVFGPLLAWLDRADNGRRRTHST